MENDLSSAECLDRARMHDCLAESTADVEARKMHRAMAAEYRRRASEAGANSIGTVARRGSLLEVSTQSAQRI